MAEVADIWGQVVDFDNHYYEPDDVFSRHIEPAFRDQAITYTETGDGRMWTMGDLICGSYTIPGVPVDRVPAPGFSAGLFDGSIEMDTMLGGAAMFEVTGEHPEWRQREARLELMDSQGLEMIVQLPSVGVIVDHDFQSRPQAMCANYRAFNRWVEEDWGYGADGRIYGAPILTLIDLDWAIKEVERVADLGAKFIWISHHPVNGKSPADPYFDPFWARVQERGLKLIYHTGFEGYTYLYGTLWGESADRPLPAWSAFQHYIGTGARPIMDAFAALVLHNLFGRFPGIEVISIECGSRWVPMLLEQMDKAAKIGSLGIQLGGPLTDTPSEIFRRHVHINPFWEEDITSLIDAIGADRILFGSDFPHPEGLTTPLDKAHDLAGKVSDADFWKIMRENGHRLLKG